MKTIHLIVLILLAGSWICAGTIDVVYLNNGSVIKGVILENEINQQIKIETDNKSIIIVKYSDIKTIKKENTDNFKAADSTDFSREEKPRKVKKERKEKKKSSDNKVVDLVISPKLGMNISTYRGNKFGNDSKYIVNFIGGLDLQIILFKHFSIMPGIYFSMKGVKYDDTGNSLFFELGELIGQPSSSSSDITERTRYFDFFLPFGYRLEFSRPISITFFTGPVWSWLLGGTRTYGDILDNDGKESVTSEYRNSDIGMTIGTVVVFGLNKRNSFGISLDFRYTMGFKNINANSSDLRSLYNRNFSLMLGFAFNGM